MGLLKNLSRATTILAVVALTLFVLPDISFAQQVPDHAQKVLDVVKDPRNIRPKSDQNPNGVGNGTSSLFNSCIDSKALSSGVAFCGDTVTAAQVQATGGRLPLNETVQFAIGDTIKCAGGLGSDYACVVTSPSGAFLTHYWEGTFLGIGDNQPLTANFDARGNYIANSAREITETEEDQAQEAVAAATQGGEGCGITSLTSFSGIGQCIVVVLGETILKIASFFLGVAGLLLNAAIVKTVFGFSTLIGNSPGLLAAWGVLRDLANMFLLFAFIFIGIQTILNTDKFSVKKALPRLLIFAILLNFSLFAAQAVIDVSNVLTAAMYNQANVGACGSGDFSGEVAVSQNSAQTALAEDEECFLNVGLAGAFMGATGLDTLFSAVNVTSFSVGAATYIGLALFATIGAFVFFAAAILFIVRAVVLTLLMVVSPIGFAALAVPQLTDIGKKWWETLLRQSFFAPVLILLMLVSLKVTESFGNVGGGGLAAAVSQPNSSAILVFLVFALVIGFMIASLIAAQKFGAAGAGFAMKYAGKFAIGSQAALTRQTVGRASGAAGKRIRSSRIGTTQFGKRLSGIADYGSKASFDVRGIKTVSKALGSQKINLGDAQQGGYEKASKDSQTGFYAYSKMLGDGRESKRDYENRLRRLQKDMDDADKAERKAIEEEDEEAAKKARKAKKNAARELDKARESGPTWVSGKERKYAYATRLADQVPDPYMDDKGKKSLGNIPRRIWARSSEGGILNSTPPVIGGSIMRGKEAAAEQIKKELKMDKNEETLKNLKGIIDGGK